MQPVLPCVHVNLCQAAHSVYVSTGPKSATYASDDLALGPDIIGDAEEAHGEEAAEATIATSSGQHQVSMLEEVSIMCFTRVDQAQVWS